MANYKKSFNLRHGVQVDDDNFIVNSNGLVGIGTSVPTEFLDVRGNVAVSGFLTAYNLKSVDSYSSGISTSNTITDGKLIINSGIVTAITGVVTYYGDGKGLTNIPTSQWIDVNPVGTAYSSIYAAGTVGIATTMPEYFLQIGDNPDGGNGVGINSTGDVKVSGILTSGSFVGSGIGITEINASNISSGTLPNARLQTNVSVVGSVTSPIFNGNLVGNVTGTASTAQSLTGTPNITVGVITASKIITDTIDVISLPIGITTIANTLHVGAGGTGFSALNSGRIGVGTALPSSEIQVRKSSGSLVEIISDSGQSRISIGNSVGVGRSTAVLRFGSQSKTFDIINNDTGNINFYLHAGPAGINTGRFAWLYGQSNNELASLTYDGKFGIGITNPSNNLHVVGTSTVTGNAFFGNNVVISGNLTSNSITLPGIINNTNINNSSGISTFYDVNITNNFVIDNLGSIGVRTTSPIAPVDAQGQLGLFGSIGIGTTSLTSNEVLNVNGIALFDSVGFGTNALSISTVFGEIQFYGKTIDLNNSSLNIRSESNIAFDTYEPRSVFDYGNVGSANTNPYMILPNVPNSTLVGLANTVEGSIIYNSTLKRHQGYGSTDGGLTFKWHNLY
jgi:hypothetical protein